MKYDPNASMFPNIGEPVWVKITGAEERLSSTNRPMMVLQTVVCPDQPGAGFESKFYAMVWHLRDVLRAIGEEAESVRDVDERTFRGKMAHVLFKQEAYTKDGEDKTATKIGGWIPDENEAAPESDNNRVEPVKDDIPF